MAGTKLLSTVMNISTRSVLRQCQASINLSRSLSTSSVRCAKAKKEKPKATPKKPTRKGEDTSKKTRISPEAEMRLAIKRSESHSSRNQNKLALDEAIKVLRAVEVRSPWSAYELLVKTAVLRGRATPRGDLVLPKDPRQHQDVIAYFVDEARAQDAIAAGAHHAGGLHLAQKILNGEITPTKVFATPSILPVITPKVARFLGPKNLMPSAKKGTVSEDFEEIIARSKGLFSWKGDRSGTIRAAIARMSFTPQEVIDNIQALIKSVHENSKDPDDSLYQKKTKKTNSVAVLSIRLSSRQGPGIELMQV